MDVLLDLCQMELFDGAVIGEVRVVDIVDEVFGLRGGPVFRVFHGEEDDLVASFLEELSPALQIAFRATEGMEEFVRHEYLEWSVFQSLPPFVLLPEKFSRALRICLR